MLISIILFGYVLPLVLILGVWYILTLHDLNKYTFVNVRLDEFLLVTLACFLPIVNIIVLVSLSVAVLKDVIKGKHLRIEKNKDGKVEINVIKRP